jgi:hypothetical protein
MPQDAKIRKFVEIFTRDTLMQNNREVFPSEKAVNKIIRSEAE